ncbi:MAG: DUF1648 domain-containing protein [Firmicutes bacterium]|nr:DUF1648 domain-containing protein [Bacillota bacterium]
MRKIGLTHRLALPGALVVLTAYLAVVNYPTLPEQIPTHFGSSGTPDSWGRKTFSGVFSLPFLQITLYAVLSGLVTVFTRRRDIRNMINLPKRDQLTEGQLEKIRSIIVDGMSLLNLVTCAMLFYIQYGTFQIVRGAWAGLGPFIWLFTVFILATSAWMLYRIFLARK